MRALAAAGGRLGVHRQRHERAGRLRQPVGTGALAALGRDMSFVHLGDPSTVRGAMTTGERAAGEITAALRARVARRTPI